MREKKSRRMEERRLEEEEDRGKGGLGNARARGLLREGGIVVVQLLEEVTVKKMIKMQQPILVAKSVRERIVEGELLTMYQATMKRRRITAKSLVRRRCATRKEQRRLAMRSMTRKKLKNMAKRSKMLSNRKTKIQKLLEAKKTPKRKKVRKGEQKMIMLLTSIWI